MIDRFHNPWFAINNIKQYKVQKINTQTMRRYQDVVSKRKPEPPVKNLSTDPVSWNYTIE